MFLKLLYNGLAMSHLDGVAVKASQMRGTCVISSPEP